MQLIFYRSKRSETDNAPGTKKPRKINVFRGLNRAGDGNRTHVSSLEGWCSTIELHPQSAQNRNRTSDTRIFSPLLYRLSYLGIDTLSTTSCILQYFLQCVKQILSGFKPTSAILSIHRIYPFLPSALHKFQILPDHHVRSLQFCQHLL